MLKDNLELCESPELTYDRVNTEKQLDIGASEEGRCRSRDLVRRRFRSHAGIRHNRLCGDLFSLILPSNSERFVLLLHTSRDQVV